MLLQRLDHRYDGAKSVLVLLHNGLEQIAKFRSRSWLGHGARGYIKLSVKTIHRYLLSGTNDLGVVPPGMTGVNPGCDFRALVNSLCEM